MNMKKNDILKLTAVSLVFSCMISCGIDIEEMKEADPDAGTELELALSCAEPLVLNESNAAETALSLSWTSGSNFGTGSSISYTLEIDRADGTWDGCYSEDLGKKVYSAASEPKTLILVPGAGHNDLKQKLGERYWNLLSEFCKQRKR